MGEGGIRNLKLFADLSYHQASGVGREKQTHNPQPGLGAYGGKHVRIAGNILDVGLNGHEPLLLYF
jgi:hypothetical protein